MKVCVTGGAGFLGSHIAELIHRYNYDVLIVDSLMWYPAPTTKFELIKASVLDQKAMSKVDADCFVHCAAVCGVKRCLADPVSVLDDYLGTRVLVRRAKQLGHRYFVYLSSSEVLGKGEAYATSEDASSTLWHSGVPRVAYALSKLMSEVLIRNSGIPWLILRPFAIYGPGQRGPGVLRNFVHAAVRNLPIVVYNTGKEIRAMCYISDFVDGFEKAFSTKATGVFNIGNPETACSVMEMAKLTKGIAGSSSEIVHKEMNHPDKVASIPDISKAKSLLGYSPGVGLHEGLGKYIDHLRSGREF